jgi:hypothetical protein
MEKYILIIIIIIIVIILAIGLSVNKENFESANHKNCCLVKKEYVENNNNLSGGEFKYSFTKLKCNDNLNEKLLIQNSNQQLLIDGVNGWSNINCSETNNILGSCRRSNFECIDFVSKEFCDKYNMKFANKTCHSQLDYIWKDNLKRPEPEFKDDGSFTMFKRWN